MLLMSTHKIYFYEVPETIIPELSSNTSPKPTQDLHIHTTQQCPYNTVVGIQVNNSYNQQKKGKVIQKND